MARTTIRSEDIADGEILVADVADDSITNAKIKSDAAIAATKLAGTLDLSSKTVTLPAAAVTAHVTAFDDSYILDNLALLSFKTAVNGSLSKFSLVDQAIDEFTDADGVDAANSTNETLSGGVWSGATWGYIVENRTTGSNVITVTGTQVGGGTFPALVNNTYNSGRTWTDNYDQTGKYVRFDWGSGNAANVIEAKLYGETNMTMIGGFVCKWQGSNDASAWTDIGSEGLLLNGTGTGSELNTPTRTETVFATNTASYRYYQIISTGTYPTNSAGHSWMEIQFKEVTAWNDLTLQSVATTAEAAPTKGDVVVLMGNAAGTATLNTDFKFYISRDGGTTWTQATLTDQGDQAGGKIIATAHNVDISSQPSGTSMKWKITTHNQASTKDTRVHAVSLGWS